MPVGHVRCGCYYDGVDQRRQRGLIVAGRPASLAGSDVSKIFIGLGKALEQSRLDVVQKAAFKAKTAHLSELDKGTSSRRLRNAGKNGARLGIMYRSKRVGYAMAEAQLSATGPLHLLDRPTVKHTIFGGTKGGSDLMPTPYGFFPTVRHPGTKGKRTFDKGYAKAKPLISKTMHGRSWEIIQKNGRLKA